MASRLLVKISEIKYNISKSAITQKAIRTFLFFKFRWMRAKRLSRRPTTINEDIRPGNKACVLGTKIRCKLTDLFDFTPATERNIRHELLVQFRILQDRRVHLRREWPRADPIDGDLLGGQFERQGLGEPEQSEFARGIGRAARQRHMAHDRCHVDDATVILPFHVRHKSPAHQENAGEIRVYDLPPFSESKIRHRLSNIDPGVVNE